MGAEVAEAKTIQFEEPSVIIMPFEKTQEFYIEKLPELPPKYAYRCAKRIFDILFAVLGLLIAAIPLAVIAVIVKCTSPGSALYFQQRLGEKGKPFNIIKFRTMCEDAEKNGACWSEGDDDPRITPVGMFLRKCRLDELPQLINVLMGDMSFVGPRPERKCFYEAFEEYIHGFSQRLEIKPGITGLAQVSGGYDLKPEEKVLYDIEYIKRRTFWLDIKILLKTVLVVFNHQGAK